MKLTELLPEATPVKKQPRDVANLSARLKSNQSLVKLLARINTSEELLQTLTTIMSLVDQTASYNKGKVLSGVKEHLQKLGVRDYSTQLGADIYPSK